MYHCMSWNGVVSFGNCQVPNAHWVRVADYGLLLQVFNLAPPNLTPKAGG